MNAVFGCAGSEQYYDDEYVELVFNKVSYFYYVNQNYDKIFLYTSSIKE